MLVAVTGCAALPGGDGPQASGSVGTNSEAGETRRDQLDDGYSALYSQLDGIAQVDKILYAKVESDDVQRVVEDVTGYCGQLAERLVTLSDQFPALDIRRDYMSPVIKAALEAQKKGTLKTFAPVVGKSGKVFERGLLIRLLGAVDQPRYLTQVLADQEPNAALRQIMQNASQHFAGLFDEINDLLTKRFYR